MWALLDDRMGSVGQAKGVMLALGDLFDIEEKKIVYTRWAKLPNFLKGCSLLGMDRNESSSLKAPWPDFVLSISRRTTPIARWIKKQSQGKTKIVQLMHPGKCGLKDLDLIIVSEHDAKKSKGDNFFFITGCPHRVSKEAVLQAKEKWTPIFSNLPKPWISVIIGGAIKGHPFSLENAKALGQEIKKIHQQIGGSILISTSRRTGAEAEKVIMSELEGIPAYTYLWGEKKENPIMGFYACGDKIIVTGDSVSMASEACGSGNSVLIFEGQKWLTEKHKRFIASLYAKGYALALEDKNALEFTPQKCLNPAQEIAKEIKKLIKD